MNEEELIPLEVDDAKVRQIITKIRKSIKSFSITNGKSFVLPPRDELLSSKYHLSFLELRNEGLAIEKLIKDAENPEESIENSNLIPKYINPHFLDGRFLIFTTHTPITTNIGHIQYDLSLKFGQIVAFHSDTNEILLGMVATKLSEDVYRVFDLSDDFMFTICTSDQLCPFPNALPAIFDASSSFSTGDKVIAFSASSLQDRKHFTIQPGEVVCLSTNAETKKENYNIKLSDGSIITTEPYFLTKFDSPFICENEQAKEIKQEHLANGIDPTVLLDPKEARKFKNANAKKLRDMKKKAAISGENQQQENNQDNAEASASTDKKKEKKKASITMATRHSPRSRSNSTTDSNANSNTNSNISVSTSPSKQASSKEINKETAGIPMKLPLTPDLHIIDPNTVPSPSSIQQIQMASPPRVVQFQSMPMNQIQQQYLFQQQMMLRQQSYVQSQTGKTQVSQSLTVSPSQFSQHQQLPIYQQNAAQVQQQAFQSQPSALESAIASSNPIDNQKSTEEAIENQNSQKNDENVAEQPATDESKTASCYQPQNDSNDQNNAEQIQNSILVQHPINQEQSENSIMSEEKHDNENSISVVTLEPPKEQNESFPEKANDSNDSVDINKFASDVVDEVVNQAKSIGLNPLLQSNDSSVSFEFQQNSESMNSANSNETTKINESSELEKPEEIKELPESAESLNLKENLESNEPSENLQKEEQT